MNGYELSRTWFDFCFENPELIKPNHTALYFFAIEHCNRMGWKRKFGFPSEMAKDAIGIKSYNTYISTFNDLVKWGFIEVIEKSRNQYSANIIALSKYDKANDKALDKAMIKHATKQRESTVQSTGESIDSIDKHITLEHLNLKTKNKEQEVFFENKKNENENHSIVDFEKMGFKGRAKKIWSDAFPDYVWGIEDDSAIVRLESRIKEFIQNKKKNEGHAEFKATKQEIEGTFEYLITHPPDFWSDKMSVSIVDKKINDFTTHAQNQKIGKNGANQEKIFTDYINKKYSNE